MATQKRGYRRNSLPWQHTALAGPSDHSTIPYTFDGTVPVSRQPDMANPQIGGGNNGANFSIARLR